ncbi:sulfotransferase [soil metagenome]
MGGPTSDSLLAEAVAQTGLDDFGPEGYRQGLDVYVEALDAEAKLSELGAMALPGTIVAALVNRLKVIDWAKAHPEVAEEQIVAPVVVVGMFRAGTTFLSNLLEHDPASRPLLRWESGDSVPPPHVDNFRSGPRVDASQAGNDMLESLNPHIRAIHHEDADGPTECIAVMSQDFKSLSWEAIANVPTYGTWLREADQTSAYEYHRTVLQVLQSGGVRGQWTLKSPHHALALDALTTVYPDARLVLLHRDPVVLSASVCSLISTLSGTFTDADHQQFIAEHWTSMLEECVSRTDAFRAEHPEHPITDVLYADLVRDPLATLATIYDSIGLELSGAAHDAMSAYVDERPKGAFGTHGYDLATYGLDPHELATRFKGYVERYDIPVESAR